jgi:hypothetical protein
MKKSTVAMLMARTSVDCGSRVVVGCVAAEIKEDTFVGEYAGWKILQGNATGARGFLMGGWMLGSVLMGLESVWDRRGYDCNPIRGRVIS